MRSIVCRFALVVATVTALSVPAVAAASTPVELGVKYLEKVQKSESATGAPLFGGDWALTSLAAGGKAAADVHRGSGTVYAREWYEGYISPSTWPGSVENPATEFEKAALVSYAAGIDPARVSTERNLLANLLSEYQTANPGYYGLPGRLEGTIFAVLALADTKSTAGVVRIPTALLKQSVEVIEKNQHTDGGWNYNKVEGEESGLKSAAEPDTTGAAMAALCTSGVKNATEEEAVTKGKEYLKSILEKDGAFKYIEGVNADSNAWAVNGLNMCGINASEFKKEAGAESPVKFLESLQIKSVENEGGFLYKPGGKVDNYSSQDAVRALAGAGFTAEPPTPTRAGQSKWNFASEFSTTVTSPLALIVNNGTELKVCSVPLKAGSAAEEASIGLLKVLEAAKAGTGVKPSGCVSKYEPESGSGAIASVNGTAGTWKVSLNGEAEKTAELGTDVELGAVIYLNG
ncbi:MAG: prenyltransferase/squalene oxidase repeat-containing protein [Solirubrobacteraceae bacterium]